MSQESLDMLQHDGILFCDCWQRCAAQQPRKECLESSNLHHHQTWDQRIYSLVWETPIQFHSAFLLASLPCFSIQRELRVLVNGPRGLGGETPPCVVTWENWRIPWVPLGAPLGESAWTMAERNCSWLMWTMATLTQISNLTASDTEIAFFRCSIHRLCKILIIPTAIANTLVSCRCYFQGV